MMTKQGLEASLYTALEFGYKCHERGMNLQAAFDAAHPDIVRLVEASGLKLEILRIKSKKVESSGGR